jgi:hypothetical protein
MELKMAATMQQQVVAMSRAESTLITAETTIDTLTSDGAVWNFETDSDGFYPGMNELDVAQADWSSFDAETGPVNTDDGVDNDDSYIIEYLGAKPIPGETVKKDINGVIVGGAVHPFLNTSRSSSGRSVVRIVQSIYVTLAAP